MAVQDPKRSKLLQLQVPGEPGYLAIYADGDGGDPSDFTNDQHYGLASYHDAGSDSGCGAAGTAPGPASQPQECESFVFGFEPEDLLNGGTTNLTMQWYNPGATSPREYTWFANQFAKFGAAADSTNAPSEVYLRFPITQPPQPPP